MNNLDLNAIGVSEMNEVEMKSLEGGNIFAKIISLTIDGDGDAHLYLLGLKIF